MSACKWCGSQRLKRSSRQGVGEYLLSLSGLYPHKCGRCQRRSLALLWTKSVTAIGVLLVMGLAAGAGLYAVKGRSGGAPGGLIKRVKAETRKAGVGRWVTVDTGAILGNEDIIKLSETKVSPRTIVKLVERTQCKYDMRPDSMIQMKEKGVADEVLYAMLSNLDQCYTDAAPTASPDLARLMDLSAASPKVQDRVSAAIAKDTGASVQ